MPGRVCTKGCNLRQWAGLLPAAMNILARLCLVSLPLVITSLTHAASPHQPPAGVAESDWSSIRAAHEAWRHGFQKTAAGYEALNPGQQWRTQFDGRGFTAQPKDGGWQWGLELKSYGFTGEERAMTETPAAQAEGQRLTYQWDAVVQEWFVNDQHGLEHGFTVTQRPASTSTAELAFTLGVRGSLKPFITSDALGVQFQNDAGATVLNYSGLKVWDADGKVLRSRFEPASEGVRLLVDEREARYPITIDPIAQQAYVKASNPDSVDIFGVSVAISGNTMVVGASGEDSSTTTVNSVPDELATDAGAAYVFVRSGNSWTLQAYLKAFNAGAEDYFGRRVAISGDTVVVSAEGEDGSGAGINPPVDELAPSAGAAYVFTRTGNTWSPQAYLKADNSESQDLFGIGLAISGNTIVVGAYNEDGSGAGVNPPDSNNLPNSGAAYVFVRNGNTWSQQAYLKASNPGLTDQFGEAVSISGDTMIVGAINEDTGAAGVNPVPDEISSRAGAAYIFVRNGNTWSQQAFLKASNPGTSDLFGISVGISGDTAVVGASWETTSMGGVNPTPDELTGGAGAAYVFVRNGAAWSQQAFLKASNPSSSDIFGAAVAISGETIVVGAPNESSSGTGINSTPDELAHYSGAGYVFVRNGSTWSQQAYVKASNTDTEDRFGVSVAISGDTAIFGSWEEDSSNSGVNGTPDELAPTSGAAYVVTGLGPLYPHMEVEQPAGNGVMDGGTRSFSPVIVGNTTSLTFTIRNTGPWQLELTGTPMVSITGPHASLFSVTSPPTTPIAALTGSTTFTVGFSGQSVGLKSASLRIQSSDPTHTPDYVVSLNAAVVDYAHDFDNDGLNDASEVQMAPFGFNWQVSQPDMVQLYYSSANGAGLYSQSQYDARYIAGQNSVLTNPNAFSLYNSSQYDQNRADGMNLILNNPNDFSLYTSVQWLAARTLGRNDVTSDPNAYSLFTQSQLQALNVGAPLLSKNPTTGEFTLTLGVQKSSDLTTFTALPMTAPQCTINGQGRLEFKFTSPGNAAFFKVQAQ